MIQTQRQKSSNVNFGTKFYTVNSKAPQPKNSCALRFITDLVNSTLIKHPHLNRFIVPNTQKENQCIRKCSRECLTMSVGVLQCRHTWPNGQESFLNGGGGNMSRVQSIVVDVCTLSAAAVQLLNTNYYGKDGVVLNAALFYRDIFILLLL